MKNRMIGRCALGLLLATLVAFGTAGKEKVYLEGILLHLEVIGRESHAYVEEFNRTHIGIAVREEEKKRWHDEYDAALKKDRDASGDFYDFQVRVGRVTYVGRTGRSVQYLHTGFDFFTPPRVDDWGDNTPVQVRIERENVQLGLPSLLMYLKKPNVKELKTALIHVIGADGIDKCKESGQDLMRTGWSCLDAWKK